MSPCNCHAIGGDGVIATFSSLTRCAGALDDVVRDLPGPSCLNVLAPGHLPGEHLWRLHAVADADDTAGWLVGRLWSGGRYGLAGMAGAAVLGALGSWAVLAAIGLGDHGPNPVAFPAVVAGTAVAFMQVGLPLGAIIEERRIEARRTAYRRCLESNGCLVVAHARSQGLDLIAEALRAAGATRLDRYRA